MSGREVELSDNLAFGEGFPHAMFTWLRDNDPVHWHDATPKSRTAKAFGSSAATTTSWKSSGRWRFSSNTGGDRTGGGTTLWDERAAGKVLNYTDNPQHKTLRQLVNKGFTARAMALLEDNLHERANLLIDAFPEGQSFDFVQAFARELPLQAICMILGVPQEDRAHLCDLIELGLEADSPNVVAVDYIKKIQEYAREIIAEKRCNPADDILSTIVATLLTAMAADGRGIAQLLFSFPRRRGDDAQQAEWVADLVENPEQLARRATRPIGCACHRGSFMDHTASTRRTARGTSSFMALSKTGDKLTIWEMSANRDDRIFNNPFTFDIARMPNRHIGFGFGAHICLGAALARLELKVGLATLLERILDFEIEGPPQWVPNNRLLGLKRLPLRIRFKGKFR